MQCNRFSGIIQNKLDASLISENCYVQTRCRILDNLQMVFRYGGIHDINGLSGEKLHQQIGLLAHVILTEGWVFSLHWMGAPFWMIRAEYSYVYSTSTVSLLDNLNIRELAHDRNIYALQVAFRI